MLLFWNSSGNRPNDRFHLFIYLQIHLWNYFGGRKNALLEDFDKPLECVNLFVDQKVSILHNLHEFGIFLMVIEWVKGTRIDFSTIFFEHLKLYNNKLLSRKKTKEWYASVCVCVHMISSRCFMYMHVFWDLQLS